MEVVLNSQTVINELSSIYCYAACLSTQYMVYSFYFLSMRFLENYFIVLGELVPVGERISCRFTRSSVLNLNFARLICQKILRRRDAAQKASRDQRAASVWEILGWG